jgi:hypothetical protein
LISLIWSNVSIFLIVERFAAPGWIEYPSPSPGKKKPPAADVAEGVN